MISNIEMKIAMNLADEFKIVQVTEGRAAICNDLLRALPLWFGIESAIQQYVKDVERMPTFVAYSQAAPIGFISLKLHNEYTAEIHVMAVHPDFHRKGVGRSLIHEVESFLRMQKYRFITAKTLSSSRANQEYEQTRKFYDSMGFFPVEEFADLWGEANPCLFMIKTL